MWILYALFSSIGAALVAIFGKIGLEKVDSTLATAIRSVIMAAFLFVVAMLSGKLHGFRISSISGRGWTFIALSALAGSLSWLFYFLALKSGNASRVSAIDRLSIVFVVVLAAIFLKEGITIKSALGAAIMAAGAVLMVISG